MAAASGGDRMWGLRELPLPEPVSWLPQTWGWAGLAAVALCAVAWLGLRRYKAWQREGYRREALIRIAEMSRNPEALETLPFVLRSTALCAFPRDEVAALHGKAWIAWLNDAGADFTPDDAHWLDELAYQPDATAQIEPASVDRLLAASRAFVRGHRARV